MNSDLLIKTLVMSAVVIALRLLPFILFKGKDIPKSVEYLGKVLPCAVMGMLVVYCLKDVNYGSIYSILPAFIAVTVTATLHAIKKNSLLSILVGTITYMVLVQFVFI